MGKRTGLVIHINSESKNFWGLRIVPSLVLDFDKPSTICYPSQSLSLSLHTHTHTTFVSGFPHSSVGKESTCSTGDLGSIPGSGRSTGEGIGYPLQYSWASLVAQLVKNPPAMWEMRVRSLGWEDTLEKGTTTHSSILAGEFHGLSMRSQRVGHDSFITFTSLHLYNIHM